MCFYFTLVIEGNVRCTQRDRCNVEGLIFGRFAKVKKTHTLVYSFITNNNKKSVYIFFYYYLDFYYQCNHCLFHLLYCTACN